MEIINNKLEVTNAKVAVVVARFNYFINKNLLDGAIDALKRVGKVSENNISVFWIPGAYELIFSLKVLVNLKKFDAIVALASIIKGETEHDKYIASECSSTISYLSMKYNIPISYGVLTTRNIEQAIERSGAKIGNKGFDAALAALEMINFSRLMKNKE